MLTKESHVCSFAVSRLRCGKLFCKKQVCFVRSRSCSSRLRMSMASPWPQRQCFRSLKQRISMAQPRQAVFICFHRQVDSMIFPFIDWFRIDQEQTHGINPLPSMNTLHARLHVPSSYTRIKKVGTTPRSKAQSEMNTSSPQPSPLFHIACCCQDKLL